MCHLYPASSRNSVVFICLGRQISFQKQNRIFQHFGRLFLPGALKNIPCYLNELLVNFRKESRGIGRFCRLEFQRMANWPSFDKKNRHLQNDTTIHPVSKKNRNWASWPPVGHSSQQNRLIPLNSSRKLTNSSLRQQGTLFNVSARKSLPSVEKSCFVFWNDHCWP